MSPVRNARPIRPARVMACALWLLLALAGNGAAEPIEVKAVPVALDPQRPGVRVVGRLVFTGGFELVSDHRSFGGLSGLDVSADGRRLRAVSDRGGWVTADLVHDSAGRLVAAGSWRRTAMLTPSGKPVRGRQRDAEGLARTAGGSFLVSFEGRHRIWRYPTALDAPPRPVKTPRDLDKAPVNGGLEGITALSDGTILGVTERHANGDGSLKGWLLRNGTAREIAYMPADRLHPTGLAAMPGGDVLLLERRLTLAGIRVRIVRLARGSLRAGTPLRGKAVAELRHPLSVDNFEGIALRRDPQGRTLLYLVSDDNFLPFQRTLLLQFRMMD